MSQLPDFLDYTMKGRTYRYFDGEPLFPFGYGLSYTTWKVDGGRWQEHANGGGTVSIDVCNTGSRKGDQTVQLYIRNLQDPNGPLKTLRAFQCVTLNPGQTQTVDLHLTAQSFEFWDPETNTMRTKPGRYELLYGTSSADKDLKKIQVEIK